MPIFALYDQAKAKICFTDVMNTGTATNFTNEKSAADFAIGLRRVHFPWEQCAAHRPPVNPLGTPLSLCRQTFVMFKSTTFISTQTFHQVQGGDISGHHLWVHSGNHLISKHMNISLFTSTLSA